MRKGDSKAKMERRQLTYRRGIDVGVDDSQDTEQETGHDDQEGTEEKKVQNGGREKRLVQETPPPHL